MSVEANKLVVRRYFGELLNNGNLQVATKIFNRNFIYHDTGASEAITGIENFKLFVSQFRTAFPDVHFTPEEEIAESDRVMGRFSFQGTHKGLFKGIQPTGKEIRLNGVKIFHCKDGKIKDIWVYLDMFNLMHQLGALPPPPPKK
ncbi:MAG: ester cyclase [Ignavibacteria bacterium]|nr:ester cyclase [Ignavibacteria bacterium]